VTTLVEAYGAGGLPQAENIAQECQQSVAEIQDQIQRLMRFEYCAGLNFAGFLINRRDIEETGAAASEYFTAQRVNERMERLNEYIDAPGVPHQVLRAWGRSVANELDRKLK
jgi:hypothetical protein